MTTPAVDAFPVLVQPYPAPSVYETTVQRPPGTLGIAFKWLKNTMDGGERKTEVLISSIHDDSPLRNTRMTRGQILLSINGITVQGPSHAAEMIRDGTSSSLTFISRDPIQAPFCKVIVRKCCLYNPGISFASTRDQTLVRISRIHPNGLFCNTNLVCDDIVLAVNNYAVSTPEQAYKALQLSKQTGFVVIYVMDTFQFRLSVLTEVRLSENQFQKDLHIAVNHGNYNELFFTFFNPVRFHTKIAFDNEKQYLIDPAPNQEQKSKHLFFEKVNKTIATHMKVFEETVACEVWKAATIPSLNENQTNQNTNSNLQSINAPVSWSYPRNQASCTAPFSHYNNVETYVASVSAILAPEGDTSAIPFAVLQPAAGIPEI